MNQRTIPHPDACPVCGSDDLVIDDVATAEGHTEIAFVCLDCDACWPLTCATEKAAIEGGGC